MCVCVSLCVCLCVSLCVCAGEGCTKFHSCNSVISLGHAFKYCPLLVSAGLCASFEMSESYEEDVVRADRLSDSSEV